MTVIDRWAFNACQKLPSVTLPETISYIDTYAFCDCSSIERLTIPRSRLFITAGTGIRGFSYQASIKMRILKVCDVPGPVFAVVIGQGEALIPAVAEKTVVPGVIDDGFGDIAALGILLRIL